MTLEKRAIGTRIMYVDNDNKLIFTKTELKKARNRYQKELAKKIANG